LENAKWMARLALRGDSHQKAKVKAVKKSDMKMSLISLYFTFYHFFSMTKVIIGKETVKFLAIFDHVLNLSSCPLPITTPAMNSTNSRLPKFAICNLHFSICNLLLSKSFTSTAVGLAVVDCKLSIDPEEITGLPESRLEPRGLAKRLNRFIAPMLCREINPLKKMRYRSVRILQWALTSPSSALLLVLQLL
jgi:hypothetical protein